MKKILALLMAVLMMVALFSSCGKKTTVITSEGWEDESEFQNVSEDENSSAADDQNASSQNQTSKDDSSKTSNKESEAPSKNKDGTFNLKGATITLTGTRPDKASATYKDELALAASIEKKFNCKLNFKVQPADGLTYYGAFTTAAMAGTKYADIMGLPGDTAFPNAALNGYIHCLDDYFDWNSLDWNDSLTNKALKLKGKRYYVVPSSTNFSNGIVIYFNKKLFDKFGATNPHEYIDQNKWTWDTFREVAKKMTRKEGTTQYYGLTSPDMFVTCLTTSNGVNFTSIRPDETRELNIDEPAFIEAIQFAYDLYNVDKVFAPANGENLFVSGYVAMTPRVMWAYFRDDYPMAYMPIGPKAKDYIYTDTACTLYAIPKAVKPQNLPALAAIMTEWLGVKKWRLTGEAQFETLFNDERSVEIATDIHNKTALSGFFSSFYSWTYQHVYWSDYGVKNQTSPQAFVQSVYKTAQAEIDVVWAKLKTLK